MPRTVPRPCPRVRFSRRRRNGPPLLAVPGEVGGSHTRCHGFRIRFRPADAGLLERLYLAEDPEQRMRTWRSMIATPIRRPRAPVPVKAVLILDRSGSMSGVKIERPAKRRARWSRRWVRPIGSRSWSSPAELPFFRIPRPDSRRALARARGHQELTASGGTNMSGAFGRRPARSSRRARAAARVDKVFLASDGQANEASPTALGSCAWPAATRQRPPLSTFGIGDGLRRRTSWPPWLAGRWARAATCRFAGDPPRRFRAEA